MAEVAVSPLTVVTTVLLTACLLVTSSGDRQGAPCQRPCPHQGELPPAVGDAHPGGASTDNVCRNLTDVDKPILDREPQRWQLVSMRKVLVFSAYGERRAHAHGPSVRVIAGGLQEQFNDVGDLYCRFWYEDQVHPSYVAARYIRICNRSFHESEWTAHFIICPLLRVSDATLRDPAETPVAVTIVPTPCAEATNALLVLNRKWTEQSNTHALCWPSLYGNYANWSMLVEMVELRRIMGAQNVVIYNQSVSSSTSDIMHRYDVTSDGVFRVIQWHFPGELKSHVFNQKAAVNDCLYRLGHQHRYVTVADLDEVLVPRENLTWPQLMRQVDERGDYGAYLFQHAYFRRNMTDRGAPYLVTQQSLWRTEQVTPPGKIRCKTMYQSAKAVSLDFHFPYHLIPGSREILLRPEVAMLHHYRNEPLSGFVNPYGYVEDRTMLRYSQQLLAAYQTALRELKKSP